MDLVDAVHQTAGPARAVGRRRDIVEGERPVARDRQCVAAVVVDRSFQADERITIDPPDTIADGMRTQQPGEFTFPVIRQLVDEILLVSDEAVIEAMTLLLLRMKILVEPTGAVAAAAALQQRVGSSGVKVGVLVSGGNVDPDLLAELLDTPSERQPL